MLSVGFHPGKAYFLGQFDLLLQGCGIQMTGYIKIGVIIVFNGAEHMLFADEIILIPKKEGCSGGKAAAVHRYIPFDVILMGIGVEEFLQPHLHFIVHSVTPFARRALAE